jgi:hypothetical protein
MGLAGYVSMILSLAPFHGIGLPHQEIEELGTDKVLRFDS